MEFREEEEESREERRRLERGRGGWKRGTWGQIGGVAEKAQGLKRRN